MTISSSGGGSEGSITVLPSRVIQSCSTAETIAMHECVQVEDKISGCIDVSSDASEKCITTTIDIPRIDVEPDEEPPQDAGCTEPSRRPELEIVSVDGNTNVKDITDGSVVEVIDKNYEDGCVYKCWGADTSHLRLWLPVGIADNPNVSDTRTCELLNNGVVINNGDGTFTWYVQDILIGKSYSMFTRVECGEGCISDYGSVSVDSTDETEAPILSIVEKETSGNTTVEVTIDNFTEGFIYEDEENPIKYVGNVDYNCFADGGASATREGNKISWTVPVPICQEVMIFKLCISAKNGERSRSKEGCITIIVDGISDATWLFTAEYIDGSKHVHTGAGAFNYNHAWDYSSSFKKINFRKLTKISDYGIQSNDMIQAFRNCANLEEAIFSFEVDPETTSNYNNLFETCYKLKRVAFRDLSTSNDWTSTFRYCYELESIVMFDDDEENYNEFPSNVEVGVVDIALPKVTTAWGVFELCYKIESITMRELRELTYFPYAFINCHALEFVSLQETTSIDDLSNCFTLCSSLTVIEPIQTETATKLYRTFYGCSSLTYSPATSISNATQIGGMFWGCGSLDEIPSHYDYSKVTDMQWYLYSCGSIKYTPFINNILGPNLDYGFYGCSNLKTSGFGGLATCNGVTARTFENTRVCGKCGFTYYCYQY